MRKKIVGFFLLFCAFLFCRPLYADEIVAQSRIEKVTVFSGSALVTRVAQVKLSEGLHKVSFTDLIPEIDDNSLKVTGEGSASGKILGAQVNRKFLEDAADKKVRELEDAIQDIRDQMRKIGDEKNVLKEEKDFLDSIRMFSHDQLPKDLVSKMPQANELEGMLKFLEQNLSENFSKNIEADIKLRDLSKKEQALSQELSRLMGSGRKQKKSIVVDIEVSRPGELKLAVSYMVGGAYWYPVYDARVNFDKAEVELISQAVVKQNTGDNWEKVSVTLSTAKVNLSATMPEVESWYIRPRQVYYEKERYKFGMEDKKALRADILMENGNVAAGMASSAPLQEEAGYKYAQAEDTGLSVVYQINRPADIMSDGAEYKLPVSSQILKSDFEYSCYPRLSSYAYLRSKVHNSKDLQLIAGRVNIFLDGGFVGSSSIKNIAPEEEFDLYLGIDENVKIKRELLEKKTDDVLLAGIPSPTKKTSYKYKTSVENYKGRKIKVSIFDNIPVSQDEKIKIILGKVTLEPKEKDWKDKPGLWRWELGLEPKAKQEIFISYTVEQPRNLEIEGI